VKTDSRDLSEEGAFRMAVKICLAGVAGRMGQRLLALAGEDPELEIHAAFDHPQHPWVGKDLGAVANGVGSGVRVGAALDPQCGADVLVDFTVSDAAMQHAEAAWKARMPAVIGVTGFNESQKARLREMSAAMPMIVAPNFSVGVNVLFKAAAMVARALGPEYEVEILEAHHDQKVDAPSGTALGLAEHIAGALNRDLKQQAVYGRRGLVGKRPKNEIGIHALRMGDVVGEHTAYFAIGGERLELTHRATSRDTFARGALRAAKWLVHRKKAPGMYTMAQVLGLD
jgi:4-hydroxy-tetrahydrodipicolinate reductase